MEMERELSYDVSSNDPPNTKQSNVVYTNGQDETSAEESTSPSMPSESKPIDLKRTRVLLSRSVSGENSTVSNQTTEGSGPSGPSEQPSQPSLPPPPPPQVRKVISMENPREKEAQSEEEEEDVHILS